MKYVIFIFSLAAFSICFSQDLQLDKVDIKDGRAKKSKDFVKFPLELSVGVGTLNSINHYTSINTNGILTSGIHYLPPIILDTSKMYLLSPNYSLGLRKRFGKFRFGINLDYSNFNRDYQNSQIDSVNFITNKSNLKVSFSSISFNSEYLLVNRNKYTVSLGLNIGALKYNHTSNFNCSRYKSYTQSNWNWNTGQIEYTNITDTISQNVDTKYENLRLIVGPSLSFEYNISKTIKTQLYLFFNHASYNPIKLTLNSDYVINGENLVKNSTWQINDYKTRYNFGANLKFIFSLGK
jgi:hypothetical protein